MQLMRRAAALTVSVLTVVGPVPQTTAQDHGAGAVGRVLDASTGEPLGNVLVAVRPRGPKATTDGSGAFTLDGLAPGETRLHVTTVGYGTLEKTVQLAPGQTLQLELALSPESLKREEGVVVTAPAFDAVEAPGGSEYTLNVAELKNLASVLADDPLRSVHSLPGVATGDDFHATFASRGLGFGTAGVYIDGVLTTAPFHTIRDEESVGGSITILSGDLVESLALMSGGAPPRYGDRIGPVLSLRTREGSRQLAGRVNVSMAGGLAATLEGPWAGERGSWLVAARKSYLDYVVEKVSSDTPLVSYYDAQAKLAYRASAAHRFSLFALYGDFDYEEREVEHEDFQDATGANSDTTLLKLQWDWLLGGKGSLGTSAFFTAEPGTQRNKFGDTLARFDTGQAGLRADLVYPVARAHRLEAGVLWRKLREEEQHFRSLSGERPLDTLEEFGARSSQPGAYLQDAWGLFGERAVLTAGLRADHLSATGEATFLPRASLLWHATRDTTLTLYAGLHDQFPRLMDLYGLRGNPQLEAQRAWHYGLALERALGARARLRVELYDHHVSDGFFGPRRETRTTPERVFPGDEDAPLMNALSGHARGLEVMLQRRSANGLTGWVSYAYARARLRAAGEPFGPFDSDFDQRHTLNVYAGVRLGRSWNLSTKFRYGSAFPLAGFYRETPEGLVLTDEKNLVRQKAYARWDLRVNKALDVRGKKLTLYAEVMNVLDRENVRVDYVDEFYFSRRVVVGEETLFPRLPAVGMTFEF